METRGEGLGIKFNRGRTHSSNSHLALEAAAFAEEHGDLWRFHRRMYKAYFEDLENIGGPETVLRVGAEAGLPEASLREALETGRYRERVDEGIAWSRGVGVTAIPTFVLNRRYAIVGAQELETFRQALDEIKQPAQPS